MSVGVATCEIQNALFSFFFFLAIGRIVESKSAAMLRAGRPGVEILWLHGDPESSVSLCCGWRCFLYVFFCSVNILALSRFPIVPLLTDGDEGKQLAS